MSSSSLLSSDSNIKNTNKAPPKPISQKLHVPIMPIASNQFPPFSYFYICVSRAINLHNCSLHSVFLIFRTHPSLQPILSPNSWCNDSEAVFNCGYSLDFTNVPHFQLGDFTPVVELYIRYPKQSQMVGVSFLPLKVIQTINVNNKPLTYLYQNNPIDLKDVASGNVVGSIFVTVALGEREHIGILDPNSPLFNNPQNLITQKKKKVEQPKKRRRYSSDYYSDYSYSDYEYDEEDWITEAMKHGWVKPGSTGNWKEKALKKGWKPPAQVCCYSVSVECDLDDRTFMQEKSVQTIKSIINDEIDEIVEDCQNVKDQFKSAENDIKELCNANKQQSTEHSMRFEKPIQIYSSNSSFVGNNQKKNMSVSNNVIYSNDDFNKITDENINIENIHESIIDKINEEEEEEDIDNLIPMISTIQETKSQNSTKKLNNSFSSDSIDFEIENEEDANASELIISGSRHSSSNSKSSSEHKNEKNKDDQDSPKDKHPENSASSSNSILSQNSKQSNKSNQSKKSNQSIGSLLSNRSLLSNGSNKSSQSNKSDKSNKSDRSDKSKGSQKSLIPKKQNQTNDLDNSSINDKSSGSILIGQSHKLLPKLQDSKEIVQEEEEEPNELSSIEKDDSKIKPVKDYSLSDLMIQIEEEEEENDNHTQSNNNKDNENHISSPIKISNLSEQLGLNKVELSDLSSPTLRYSSTVGTQKIIADLSQSNNKSQINQPGNVDINTPIKLDHEPIPISPESDSDNFF